MRINELFKPEEGKAFDKKTMTVCVLTSFCLTMNKYLPELIPSIHFSDNKQLSDLVNWVMILCTFYFVFPAAVIKIFFKESLSGYGLKWKGAFADYWIYFTMLFVMVPLVIFFSTTPSFQAKYPFYELAPGEKLFPYFWMWEGLYFLQFFALEFFFRGFMVHGLKHRFGFYSVLVMTIPYCMIHFGKPLPETVAAIIAGIALGALSLKTRSIILGVCIHFSVGLMMDLAALYHKTH
jgi:uncharacterized protein